MILSTVFLRTRMEEKVRKRNLGGRSSSMSYQLCFFLILWNPREVQVDMQCDVTRSKKMRKDTHYSLCLFN